VSSEVEHVFELFAAYVALAVELAAVLAVAVGAAEAAAAAFQILEKRQETVERFGFGSRVGSYCRWSLRWEQTSFER
jgi:hypothetical protein